MVNDIRRDSFVLSLSEAFLESAPQIVVQTTLLMSTINSVMLLEPWLVPGILTSLLSCTIASKNLFFFQRPGYQADVNPSWKLNFLFLPPMTLLVVSNTFLWSLPMFIANVIVIGPFFLYLFVMYLVVFIKKENRASEKNKKFLLVRIVSSFLLPFTLSKHNDQGPIL
jgi:hypothetical protein